jgi:hypothetical protein
MDKVLYTAEAVVDGGRNVDASDARITARVGLDPTGQAGFTLSVSLDLQEQPATN